MYFSRRQTLALVFLLSLALIGGGILAWRQAARGAVTVAVPEPDQEQASPAPAQAVVHVCGAVRNPGVYILPAAARVYEAVAKAGGALPEADQSAVNLAARLVDGEQIYLPRKGEAPAVSPAAGGDSGGGGTAAASAAKAKFPVRLNQAGAGELEAVPGIGPALAARIIAYRQANGPFAQVEDLLNVSGIGQKTLDKLRPYLLAP